ncbi:hypothetical protein EYF80_011874 [Liparis tanakae]|uniref:Uncharacterized protein n=1 Tax=Liparis tanakae TaxID=230148 RepID=A0A4Z2IJ44_9TELE|nr:hypothetical protein EYF80_011874 [Liparis tanakae]
MENTFENHCPDAQNLKGFWVEPASLACGDLAQDLAGKRFKSHKNQAHVEATHADAVYYVSICHEDLVATSPCHSSWMSTVCGTLQWNLTN